MDQLHLFFFPFMSPWPKLFAAHGVKATIITTPLNVSRFRTIIDRHNLSGHLPIHLHVLNFPSSASDLPKNCENLDTLPSRLMISDFYRAIIMLQPQSDLLVRQHQPDAIISDLNLPWTAEIARKYRIPRIIFHGSCCFSLSVTDSVSRFKPHATVSSDTEPFLVPGLPDPVHVTKAYMPNRFFANLSLHEISEKFMEAERNTYGVVANSFYEIEPEYVEHYEKVIEKKVWPVGPVSLCNTKALDMAERGNKASIDKDQCLTWLDSKKPNSVLYVCFGSLCVFAKSQLLEIGLGLEASKKWFIWVIRDNHGGGFLPEGYEERVKERGLIIRGWAPQVLILNHPAVGGFMTHCGWNSILESLRIGVGMGVESGLVWGEEEKVGALVKRDRVEEVVTRLMCGGEPVDEMRKRASEHGDMARSAVSESGSSYVNVGLLIEDILNQRRERLARDD